MGQIMALEDILKELHTVSGFRMSLYDADGRQLCVYPKEMNPFCHLIQTKEEVLACCHRFDREAFARVKRTGEVYIYQCHCALYEAVAPLYDFGVLSGYLMMGQVLDTSRTNIQEVISKAEGYGAGHELLAKAARQIPRRTKEQIRSCISIMEICAGYLSLSNYLRADRKDLPGNVRSYIDRHYGEALTLESLCREFYCSRATLTTSFRHAYGQSVIEYLTEVRLEQGKSLLGRTDRKIGEISELCGYPDQNYFCKIFKRRYGMAPSSYRGLVK